MKKSRREEEMSPESFLREFREVFKDSPRGRLAEELVSSIIISQSFDNKLPLIFLETEVSTSENPDKFERLSRIWMENHEIWEKEAVRINKIGLPGGFKEAAEIGLSESPSYGTIMQSIESGRIEEAVRLIMRESMSSVSTNAKTCAKGLIDWLRSEGYIPPQNFIPQ